MSEKLITLATMQEFNRKKTKNIFVSEDGSTVIQGNFKVEGVSTTLDTQTLSVKDNLVITNSDGETLAGESGFVIKTGGASNEAYGITYNPNSDIDGVRIGLGNINNEGAFIYQTGEAQFLATRADAIVNGNLVQWDNSKNTLIDTGKSIYSFVDKKNGSTTYNQVYLKLSNGTQDMLDVSDSVQGSSLVQRLSNGHIKVASNPDAGDYAVNKDYVDDGFVAKTTSTITDDKVIRVYAIDKDGNQIVRRANSNQETDGLMLRDGAGRARVNAPYDDKDIANKEYVDNLPDNLTLTDDDKTKWCDWLGAVPVPTAHGLILYQKATGTYKAIPVYQNSPASSQIPQANAKGCIKTNTPEEDLDCTNKKYVDDGFVAKRTDKTTYEQAYVKSADGVNTKLLDIDNSNTANSQMLVKRDTAGAIYVPDSSIGKEKYNFTAGQEAVNRRYVDDGFVAIGEPSTDYIRVYTQRQDGTIAKHILSDRLVSNSIPMRTAETKNFWVGTPQEDNECANKVYVDGLIAELLARIEALEAKLSTMTEEVT